MTPPIPINKAAISTTDNYKDKIAIVVTTVTTTYRFLRLHLNKLSELYNVALLPKKKL